MATTETPADLLRRCMAEAGDMTRETLVALLRGRGFAFGDGHMRNVLAGAKPISHELAAALVEIFPLRLTRDALRPLRRRTVEDAAPVEPAAVTESGEVDVPPKNTEARTA